CLSSAHSTTAISPLSLHDALPISVVEQRVVPAAGEVQRVDHPPPVGDELVLDVSLGHRADLGVPAVLAAAEREAGRAPPREAPGDRKSQRLNSSPRPISYALFCFK